MSLSLAYEMKPKLAAGLLTDNHSILMHMCVKGGKGSNFEKVLGWYGLIQADAEHLVDLINTEKKSVLSFGTPLVSIASKGENVKENRGKILFKTLNILKSGFYSKNSDVQF
jgi:hypothetical protein